MIQNRKRCSKVVLKRSISGNFVLKSVQKCAKCDRTSHVQKRAARTHIPHTFQNGFRTHTHTCDHTSHVCVRARTFATHTLVFFLENPKFVKIFNRKNNFTAMIFSKVKIISNYLLILQNVAWFKYSTSFNFIFEKNARFQHAVINSPSDNLH